MAIYTMLHPCVTEQLECLLALQMGGKMVRKGDLLKNTYCSLSSDIYYQVYEDHFVSCRQTLKYIY